jgi:molybdopterin converting factor small subunit
VATVRLFANLRELAGSGRLEVDAGTVGEVLDVLVSEHGAPFQQGLDVARVWRNGDPAEPEMAVGPDDEVAIIPPVSGGSGFPEAESSSQGVPLPAVAAASAGLVLAVANAFDSPAWFIAVLVGVLGLWALDLVEQGRYTGTGLRALPLVIVVFLGTSAGWWFAARGSGATGIGVAAVLSVLVTLILASFRPDTRSITSVSTTMMVSALAAVGGGSLAAVRLAEGGQTLIWLYLVMVALGAIAAGASRSVRTIAVLDPLVAGAIGTILGGLVMALLLDIQVVGFLLVSILLALAVIAGRALGALGRTGELYLAEDLPGYLPALDGAVIAGAVYLFAVTFFT